MARTKEVKVFVYGTLMKNFRNYYKYLDGNVISFKIATTNGEMYHLNKKDCPAMVYGNNTIHGEVMTFRDDEELTLLRQMDSMEEYFEGSSKLMYKREEITICYDDKREDRAFAYIFINKELLNKDDSEYIEHGDWAKYIEERAKAAGYSLKV